MTKARTLADNFAADINGITAGTGITGGGTSGTVTITNQMATTIDAKGDLVVGTGADTFAKLTVGANDTVLMADSSTATGLKWAAVSSGGMTLLASGNLSSNTLTISSISGTYNDLQLILRDFYMASDDYINIRFNSDTGNNYGWIGFNHTSEDVGSVSADGVRDRMFTSFAAVDNADNNNFAITTIYDYANTSHNKLCQINSIVRDSTNAYFANMSAIQNWRDTSAITSITLFTQNASNFSGGSYVLYGVK